MAKKKTAKEKRMEQHKKMQEKIVENQKKQLEQREREEEAKKEAERQKKKEEYQKALQKIEAENEEMKLVRKSKAKAAGLKSTFVLDNQKILMTSFGKGNQALRDKYIDGEDITDASEDAVLSVQAHEKSFVVSGRIRLQDDTQNASVNNPMLSQKKPGQDLIRCREKLERMYFDFGRTFEDNIHIQLIYNILDIEKVLAVQVNNIVFALDNLLRRPEEEHDDLIGYMGLKKDYDTFRKNEREVYEMFQELIKKPQMGYFGKTFLPVDEKGKTINRKENKKEWDIFEKKCYHLFAVLGMLRQATAHGNEKTRANIYKLGEQFDKSSSKSCRVAVREELNKLYQSRVHELNEDFLEMSKKDLTIFFHAFQLSDDREKKYVVREYYKFVVLKTFKNMGFSIKRLRETIIDKQAPHLKNQKYDTVRKKLYRAVDFSIYLYYQKEDNQERVTELVERLRASSKESEKEIIYRMEAKVIWDELKKLVDGQILPKMNGNYIKDLKTEKMDAALLEDVWVKEHADPFSEMIYLLTIFLDGKEINDLLTQLINRFDNISSFLEVMRQEKLPAKFQKDYSIFEKSSEISYELRIINSFARMSEPDPSAKKVMFIEAAKVLGFEADETELETYIDNMLKPKGSGTGGNKNGFRNFIINNVIESSRFKYLVRYGNPSKIRTLASNEKVVGFVLNGIPDAQITAYYNSCYSENQEFFPEMRKDLTETITSLHFKDFENVYQGKTKDIDKIKDKERRKNIIRLYLTVLYLLQKNLIYVNSRYFLAFHCAERDAMVFDSKIYTDSQMKKNRAIFAADFVRKYSTNKRAKSYIQQNFRNADKWSLNAFRNCTEHLNAVRNADKYIGDIKAFQSYFELYHYLVQRSLIDQFVFDCQKDSSENTGTKVMSLERAEGKLLDYFELVKKHGTYCKDFVKALNVPFAYNLPRYKNLSINELFDRNNYLPNKGTSKGDELRPMED